MATPAEVANAALALVNSDAGVVLAAQWVNARYAQLVSRQPFRHLRRFGSFVIPAAVTAGTITVTRGSTLVTGDATAQAAWVAAPLTDLIGRFLRPRSAWYEIVGVDPTNTALRIGTEFAENDVSAGSYAVVQRYATLAEGARRATLFVHGRLWEPLRSVSLGELDRRAPGRFYSSALPYYVADIGEAETRERRVEIWPYSTVSEPIEYVYWVEPRKYGLDEDMPRVIDSYVLREGALVDIMRHGMATATTPEMWASWRNEYRAQEATWERRIQEAARQDRGADDLTALMTARGHAPRFDIRTARDHIVALGNRP